MGDKIETLHELCETISQELEKCNDKIRKSGGELSAGDIEYLDKLTHAMKSIKTTIAMMEAEEGYSNDGDGGSYRDGMSRTSYKRGGTYAKRYNNGQYAPHSNNRGYSYDDRNDLLDELNGALMMAKDDTVRRDIKRLVEKVESM